MTICPLLSRTLLVALAFCFYGIGSPAASFAVDFQTLALSDQLPAEIGLGAGSYTFDTPALSSSGDVVYRAMFDPNDGGASDVWAIWKDTNDTKQLIAKTGDDALVEGYSFTFVDFELPEINQSGEMAFYGSTTYGLTPEGKTIGGPGVWKASATGTVEKIVSNGDFEPGTGNKFRAFGAFPAPHIYKKLHISTTGDVLLFASIRDTIAGENETSMWSTNGGLHRAYEYEVGYPVSGLPLGYEFDEVNQSTGIDEYGRAIILSSAIPYYPASGNSLFGMLTEQNGIASLAWKHTVAPPGISNPFSIEISGGANWNNVGQVLLSYRSDSSPNGLVFLDPDGISRIVVADGGAAPGTPWNDATFGYLDFDFSDTIRLDAINNVGQTAFLNILHSQNARAEASGLWVEDDGDTRMVVMEEMAAPGIPDAIFSTEPGNERRHWSPDVLTLNDAGRVAFSSRVWDFDIDPYYAIATGIWAEDAEHNLTLIARTGGTIETSPGDHRIISSLDILGNIDRCSSQERNSGFNSLGQVAFRATFTDGTEGIFLSNAVAIPEPTSLLLLTVGLLSTSVFRRRSRM